ncbi:MAG: BON domain-containing protein, partial [Pseudomonadota bacterium]|nr:BON domain-containing protein [Pseudomonadota bacterium]
MTTSLVFLSLHFFGTTGCTNVILSAGTAAVTAAQEERGLATAANDLAIQANINALFLKQELYSWPAITVSVFDGRVLLTGAVTQKTDRAKAENIAKRGR